MKSFREYDDDENDSTLMFKYRNARDLMRKMTQTIDSNNEKLDCETLLFDKKEWLLDENEIIRIGFKFILGFHLNEKLFLYSMISYYIIKILSSRALEALKFLVQEDAYRSKKRLSELWELKNYRSLAYEIIAYIRSFTERIYSNETKLTGSYLDKICYSPYRRVLNSFFPIKTETNGDCFYQAISIALIGNESLATAIRFATVAKIIELKVPLKTRVLQCYENRNANNYPRRYIFKLKDLAFSAGLPTSLLKETRFPEHLFESGLDLPRQFNYARTFHQFIVSMITNRPIDCYGVLDG